jgi:hypothetical protein
MGAITHGGVPTTDIGVVVPTTPTGAAAPMMPLRIGAHDVEAFNHLDDEDVDEDVEEVEEEFEEDQVHLPGSCKHAQITVNFPPPGMGGGGKGSDKGCGKSKAGKTGKGKDKGCGKSKAGKAGKAKVKAKAMGKAWKPSFEDVGPNGGGRGGGSGRGSGGAGIATCIGDICTAYCHPHPYML